MIVAAVSLKGGVGKSTISVALAEAAATGGSALLLDTDPQGSTITWAEEARAAGAPLAAEVRSLPTRDLDRRLADIGPQRYRLVVLDTPPGHAEIISAALAVADLAIVPVRPALADLSRAWTTLEAARTAGTPALVVVSMARLGTTAYTGTRLALVRAQADVAKTLFPLREAIAADFGQRLAQPLARLGAELLAEIEGDDRYARS